MGINLCGCNNDQGQGNESNVIYLFLINFYSSIVQSKSNPKSSIKKNPKYIII